jgi:hypothetical protein
MNIVYVNHGFGKDYVFRVPDDMVKHIHKGDTVVAETMYGISTGVCTTGVISGEGALDRAQMDGAYTPLKPIIGKLYPELRDVVVREIINTLEESSDVPF